MMSFRFITVGEVYMYFWFNKNYWSNASRHSRATPRMAYTRYLYTTSISRSRILASTYRVVIKDEQFNFSNEARKIVFIRQINNNNKKKPYSLNLMNSRAV